MNKFITYLGTALITLSIVDAKACSCASVSEQQRYLGASNVFIGKVIETKLSTTAEKIGELDISTDIVEAKISVTKAIKGKLAEHVNVLDTVPDGANCAVGLTTGREYLFYLHDNSFISICDGSRLYNEFSDQELIEEMLSY